MCSGGFTLHDFVSFIAHLRRSTRLVRHVLVGLFIVLIGLAGIISVAEDLSFGDALYFTLITGLTVGYGDIAPVTPLGKGMAALIMVFGYSMIVVPTGIISAEIASANARISTQACPECSREGHDANAVHCKFCGARL